MEEAARANGGDLELARGCALGDRAALARFEAAFGAVITSTARRFGTDDFAKEVAQSVRERLLVAGPAGGPPRIAEYGGHGPLMGYVQAVTVRVALNRISSQARHEASGDDAVLELPSGNDDPELAVIKQRYGVEFKQAFSAAMASLDPDLRAALRLYYLDGLALADLGRLYGWSVPTASRRLAAARSELLSATRAHLGQRLGMSPREVASVLRLLESRLSAEHLSTL